jgi:sulfur carrier protein
MTLSVMINGESRSLPGGTTVADVVSELSSRGKGTAVARNGEVVPRSLWSTTSLVTGDAVEVLTAAQGG